MSLLFIEATRFTERVQQLRAEGELWKLEDQLCRDPEAGDVIQGTSGFRKVRMRLPGRGKRGGCRVIYFYVGSAARIYFVYLYPKNEEVDLSADQKKALKCIVRKIYEDIRKIHQLTDDEFAELRAGAEEVLAHARGKKITLRTRAASLPRKSLAFSPARIRSIRSRLNVSQPIFAKLLYVTKDTAAKWEQGVRKPSGSALRLLEIAERRPEVLVEG